MENFTRRAFLSILLLLAVAGAHSAWGLEPDALSPATLRIGVIVPLTGPLADVGSDIRDGMKLAMETLPAGSPKFELLFEDSRHDLRLSVTAAQKLLNEDHADVLVSLWDCADVVAPITEQKKKLHLAIRWNPDIAARYHYTFTLESTYRSYTHDQLKLLQSLGVKRIAIIQAQTSGWELATAEAQKSAADYGISITASESFVQGETDFRPVLLKLLRQNPDYLVLESLTPDTQNILRQLHEIRPEQHHIGYYEILDKPELAGTQPFIAQFDTGNKFEEDFQARFGHPYRIRAPHAHALIELLSFAVQRLHAAEKPSAEQIIGSLMAIRSFPSVIGPLTVGPERSIENPNVVKVSRNGRFEIYAPGTASSDRE